ncbi:tyrosine-type recombinase/integrase [Amycolatopsis sp. CA-230715]|uniref:tyrosine-type recombinase/integrase n=1 Tax=Amycolatopsis sp. CA-230715 TaxID=2745196 RepID=UPI001C028FB6|nr:tyrosine-type recombinase/integrase [Amycolatopsis sp. CA-230715]QWF85060.1 Tyrosine recombinase XerC [Amycolatopsis sp. CA-230715]
MTERATSGATEAAGYPAKTGRALAADVDLWPGVDDPAALLGHITDWLAGYGNHATRRTYAEGLGLPTRPSDIDAWEQPSRGGEWTSVLARYQDVLRIDATESRAKRPGPPPAAPGRLRRWHWFRWCAATGVDPRAATSRHVKSWLDALAGADAAPATRDRMLATVKALYAYLAEIGVVTANPAALNRRRLGLTAAAAGTSRTVTLTSAQVRALYATAAQRRPGASALDTHRAVAVIALFTLGLRVSELCGLDRADLHVTRGRRALRVHGKGGKDRIVYLSGPADTALTRYLVLRDDTGKATGAAVTRRQRGTRADTTPLLLTRTGRRFQRQAIWQLLRRVAAAGGEELTAIAGALHPHALRHFYVTTAVEAGAQLTHVQADVGHSSIDTTQQTYDHAARDPARSAVDLVADTWHGTEEPIPSDASRTGGKH